MHKTSVEVRTHLLKILDEINVTHTEVIITKRGVPVAKLVPLSSGSSPLGLGVGLGETTGDIVQTDWSDEWESLS